MSIVSRLSPLNRLAAIAGRTVLDAIYPLECVGCGGSGKIICDACAAGVQALTMPYCEICAVPGDFVRCPACSESVRSFDGIRAPYRYSGVVRQAILALKYGGIRAAAQPLGDMLGEYLKENPLPGDVLLPVPMHSRRQRERGYNQAALLARRVAGHCGILCEEESLVRTRHIDPQAGTASALERAANVADSVAVKAEASVKDARIILVDDVSTTGSTLNSCAKALKEAGAASVWGLTLAVSGGE